MAPFEQLDEVYRSGVGCFGAGSFVCCHGDSEVGGLDQHAQATNVDVLTRLLHKQTAGSCTTAEA